MQPHESSPPQESGAPRAPRSAAPFGGAAPAAALAPATKDALATIAADDQQRDHDFRSARNLVLVSLGVAAVAAGVIEWAGIQVAMRHGADDLDLRVRSVLWAVGSVRNLFGAVFVGGVSAAVVALFQGRFRRPIRAAASAFALGTGTVLAALAALTAWAP